MEPKQILPLWVRGVLGIVAMNGYSSYLQNWNLTIRCSLESYLGRQFWGRWVLLLRKAYSQRILSPFDSSMHHIANILSVCDVCVRVCVYVCVYVCVSTQGLQHVCLKIHFLTVHLRHRIWIMCLGSTQPFFKSGRLLLWHVRQSRITSTLLLHALDFCLINGLNISLCNEDIRKIWPLLNYYKFDSKKKHFYF